VKANATQVFLAVGGFQRYGSGRIKSSTHSSLRITLQEKEERNVISNSLWNREMRERA